MTKKRLAISVVLGFMVFIGIALATNLFRGGDLPVQIAGALLEAVVTALITYFLLTGQTASETKRDKDIKIFEQKVLVFSEFTEKMWGILADDSISEVELLELRDICFKKLVFYLDNQEIKDITTQILSIDPENDDSGQKAVGEITQILRTSLRENNTENKNNSESGNLKTLFNSFKKVKSASKEVRFIEELKIPQPINNNDNINYWHFNIFDEHKQLQAFVDGNWILSLIEYGEDWRTNAVKQVTPNDIVFLFLRGGYGYIGAFRVKNPAYKILDSENHYDYETIKKYDIYDGLSDGATLVSNILVEPIAYNCNGVGYKSVRRRTIERMLDEESVKFLLNRFNGNDLEDYRIESKDKFADGTVVKDINKNFFTELVSKLVF